MSSTTNSKLKVIDTDSDEEDDAQMRLFLEAADHTLLTNDMFKTSSIKASPAAAPAKDLSKSERFLAEQDAGPASDLQVSPEMQTHLWQKLSTIIQNQIEYCATEQPSKSGPLDEKKTAWYSRVKLVADADCYVVDDIEPELIPQRKPTIRRRQLEGEELDKPTTSAALASVAVSGDSILNGQDVLNWAPRRCRKDKLFEYKACDELGHKLLAIDATNEFTAQRRKNNWNETKISQRFQNKKTKL
ncbi:uncharacterized protein [Drosophila virilis]|uniref:Protein CUSTOS n=1 Tax=Drosophila virilis TaxID=7244 RepID=B4MAD3_DROVI|nr:uncharacterized protein LOC6634583 [Drosophila virilis]EDW66192.1 uncharacterized protein Dvir_GJ15685 [Drosophila virilis]